MSQVRKLFVLGIVVALAGWLAIAIAPWIDLEQDFGLPWLFRARGSVAPPDVVVIVAIDEASAESLGTPERLHDWPRSLHAELVRWLARAGARLIVFDMTFDTPSPQPGQDEALAAAIAGAGNVLVSESVRKDTLALDDGSGKPVASMVIERTTPPIPIIAQALLGRAAFVVPKAARVDAYWTYRNGATDTPTLPVLALRSWAADPRSPAGAGAVSAAERQRIEATLARLEAAGDMAYLNLYGPPRSIRTLSYARVLQDARAPAALDTVAATDAAAIRDRAVFVGFSANTPAGQDRLRDDHRTVFSQEDGLNLSGVELAATAFANLLQDRPLRPLSTAWQLAIATLWALLLATICGLLRPSIAVPAAAVLAGVWLWWALDRFTAQASWWPSIVPIGVQLPLALFVGIWLHYRQTRREREEIKRVVGYYLPRSVVDQLVGPSRTMTQANRVVFGSCLATDLSRYTALAESMDPARLGRLLNDYFAELFVPVERSGGVIVDVVGDAMVAIWTAKSSQAAARRSACEAALEIVAGLDRFNRGAPADRPALDTRLGLHCGDILIGNVGASRHYEYRAVGDIINTASRLEGLNKVLGTRLLASAATTRGLDDLRTRPMGSFRLAGKANEVAVVELLGSASSTSAGEDKLCAQFAHAIGLYGAARWREAVDAFGSIQAEWPTDGPARFYLERCTRLLADPPGTGWSPTIVVEAK